MTRAAALRPPPDPALRAFVRALARAAAREDHAAEEARRRERAQLRSTSSTAHAERVG